MHCSDFPSRHTAWPDFSFQPVRIQVFLVYFYLHHRNGCNWYLIIIYQRAHLHYWKSSEGLTKFLPNQCGSTVFVHVRLYTSATFSFLPSREKRLEKVKNDSHQFYGVSFSPYIHVRVRQNRKLDAIQQRFVCHRRTIHSRIEQIYICYTKYTLVIHHTLFSPPPPAIFTPYTLPAPRLATEFSFNLSLPPHNLPFSSKNRPQNIVFFTIQMHAHTNIRMYIQLHRSANIASVFMEIYLCIQ